MNTINRAHMKFHPVIGLEIHVQLNTKTKLFCSCLNEYAPDTPNKNICPFCTGQPGALPRLNKEAIRKAIKLGVILGAKLPARTRWDRKNYFYPDLPSGYQISQYDNPIIEGGSLAFFTEEERDSGEYSNSSVQLERAHLEADAAKLIHAKKKTMVDFNRSCAPLLEIVTRPQITSSNQAMAFVTELQLLVRRLEIANADMEKGQMRFDCNISLQNDEEHEENLLPPYKVEIKNINSVRSLGRAIEFEIVRQHDLLIKDQTPKQETRGWRDSENKSVSQRSKEQAMDYRYFPEPDLKVLELRPNDVPDVSDLPELPQIQRHRFLDMGMPLQVANTFVAHPEFGDFFDNIMMAYAAFVSDKNPNKSVDTKTDYDLLKTAAFILTEDLGPSAIESNISIHAILKPKDLVEIAYLFSQKEINNQGMAKLIAYLIELQKPEDVVVTDLIESLGIKQVNDEGTLSIIVDLVIQNNPDPIQEYKDGKVQVIGFLIGQCMKESKGKGNPTIFKEILEDKLN